MRSTNAVSNESQNFVRYGSKEIKMSVMITDSEDESELQLSDRIIKSIVKMVFNSDDADDIHFFTNVNRRQNLDDPNIVWKNGNSRYPHINRFTGAIGMYLNTDIVSYALTHLSELRKSYDADIALTHGPPALLVKPNGAGPSPPFVYRFQDLSEGIKYTMLIPLCGKLDENQPSGEVEVLTNFEFYYDFLSAYYNFDAHSKADEMLYLEKWFNIKEANEVVEEYVALYNYHEFGTLTNLRRKIRTKVSKFYRANKTPIATEFKPMFWQTKSSKPGQAMVFSSKQALRTVANSTFDTRIYLQVAAEPLPEYWPNSLEQQNLIDSYATGKFGNWTKPGLRRFLRENSFENTSTSSKVLQKFTSHQWTDSERTMLALN